MMMIISALTEQSQFPMAMTSFMLLSQCVSAQSNLVVMCRVCLQNLMYAVAEYVYLSHTDCK